ncbi:MAG: 3-dehydroquinate synthase [Kiritimatiellaeota bacterium]|nr:3-dehydroquinate synthase [Kiritimatiellota bacterium]
MSGETERTLQKIDVRFEYEVAFTEDVFNASNPTLGEIVSKRPAPSVPVRVMFIIEKEIAEKHPRVSADISEYIAGMGGNVVLSSPPAILAGGEELKTFKPVERLCAIFAENKLCRHSFVGVVGGGAFLDVVGFAASLVHRGVRQIRFPTTTLSQNDSGVGVKTGINMFGKKNYVGTFAPPYAVVNDSRFLRSLEYRDWISGVPEAFKVAMIADADFFDFLLDSTAKLADRDESTMSRLIQRSAKLHLNYIATSGDPFETGSARPLDFGHWAAHKLESMTDGALRHGEAVGIGLLIDSRYAADAGLLDRDVCEKVRSAFKLMGLPLFHEALLETKPTGELAVLDGIEDFREHLGGELHVTLPNGIGEKLEVTALDKNGLTEIIRALAR